MLNSTLANVLFLTQLFFGGQMLAQTPAALPAVREAVEKATAPTTAPSVQDVKNAESILAAFNKTRTARIARGEERLSIQDLKEPGFWVDSIKELIITTVGFIPRFLVACIFFLAFWILYRTVRRVVFGSLSKTHVDPSIRDMMGHIVKWGILGFGLVIACNQIGIQITALLTGVSLIGLAVGFAAQETLANFIAGVVIFWDKPFKVGEWVTVDGTFGQVQRVTFRSTRVLDGAGCVFIFPNTQMLSHKVCNHSTHPINAVSIPVSIAYRASIDKARELLLALPGDDDRICTTPAPSVGVKELTDGAVVLSLNFWISDESKVGGIRGQYLEKIKNAFDAAGVELPASRMQVYLENSPGLASIAGNGRPIAGSTTN